MDFTIFYKESYENGEVGVNSYDLFFSAYDNCDRTKVVFDKIESQKKIWFLFPHYNLEFTNTDGTFDVYSNSAYKEDDFFVAFFETNQINFSSKICVDITGFLRPHLMYFIKYLYLKGVKTIDFLYTEPHYYKKAEETTFSGFINEVKVVEGCGSAFSNPNTDNDILITTAGYDDKLIAKVVQHKSKIKNKYHILGFPSLQPDMYQESILKIHSVKDSIGIVKSRYAPANDPFVTAQVIDNIIKENSPISNIYLSPLSTKPQTLGIIFYYLWMFNSMPLSIIFPYSNNYSPKTAEGIKKTWKYTFDLP